MRGDDGRLRCPWGDAPGDYRAYHDDEWGRPVHGDTAAFERLSLEAFQCGLSWLTVLRRRADLRRAFADFEVHAVAAFDAATIAALAADVRLIRHVGKIEAVVANARVLRDWQAQEGVGVLDKEVWGCVPTRMASVRGPQTVAEVPTTVPAAVGLAARLKGRGWRYVGPTTAYSTLQAMGVVDDHLQDCHARRAG